MSKDHLLVGALEDKSRKRISVASARVVEPHCYRNWKHTVARKFGYDVYVHPCAQVLIQDFRLGIAFFELFLQCVNSCG